MNLAKAFFRLRKAGTTLDIDKCAFRQETVKFLGHIVPGKGVKPDPEKVDETAQITPPSDMREARSFLGMATHLAKFSPIWHTQRS